MEYGELVRVLKFAEVYEYLAGGGSSVQEFKAYLKAENVTGGNFKRRVEFLTGEGEPAPFIEVFEDEIIFDKAGYLQLWKEAAGHLGLEEYLLTLESKRDSVYLDRIKELEQENAEAKRSLVEERMTEKVLVASSIEVGPQEDALDDIFLRDLKNLLDVDACAAKCGGIIDSFFKEIPTDAHKSEDELGHELNNDNYAKRNGKVIGTKRFFAKLLKDNQKVREFEKEYGKLYPTKEEKKERRDAMREQLLKNRIQSINRILESDELTNQQKLMLYALNSPYHNTNVERLLRYAGLHCIPANFVIRLLVEPDVWDTYENMISFLDQFANPSEFRMKLDLARELIEGKWYIMADYNGKKQKFQLVPVEELRELRAAVGLPDKDYEENKEEC